MTTYHLTPAFAAFGSDASGSGDMLRHVIGDGVGKWSGNPRRTQPTTVAA